MPTRRPRYLRRIALKLTCDEAEEPLRILDQDHCVGCPPRARVTQPGGVEFVG